MADSNGGGLTTKERLDRMDAKLDVLVMASEAIRVSFAEHAATPMHPGAASEFERIETDVRVVQQKVTMGHGILAALTFLVPIAVGIIMGLIYG
jgi:hypothetical protein